MELYLRQSGHGSIPDGLCHHRRRTVHTHNPATATGKQCRNTGIRTRPAANIDDRLTGMDRPQAERVSNRGGRFPDALRQAIQPFTGITQQPGILAALAPAEIPFRMVCQFGIE
jgi:hypothetical protein